MSKCDVNIQAQEGLGRWFGTRALQQQQVKVTVVTTPQQLLDALEDGAQHIDIRAHLDLTTITPRDNKGVKRMLNDGNKTTSDFAHSLRVCSLFFIHKEGSKAHPFVACVAAVQSHQSHKHFQSSPEAPIP